MATLSEIAAQAGVSEATVSRVLNGKPGVSDGARQAVLTALDVLGYERPSRLRRRSAGLVGLVVPELENPIFPAFAQVIEDGLARRRYTPGALHPVPRRHLRGRVRRVAPRPRRRRDHLRLRPARGHHSRPRALPASWSPAGCRSSSSTGSPPDIDAPFLSTDDARRCRWRSRHLAQLGHRKIGLAVGPRRFVPSRARARASWPPRPTSGCRADEAEGWIGDGLFTVEGGAAAADALLDHGATAIVCASDLMALGAIRAARERGLACPATSR